MPDTNWLRGTWTGRGYWTDESGERSDYSIEMEIALAGDGLHIRFQHAFDNGDDAVHAAFDLCWLTDSILTLSAAGAELGKGYLLPGCLHYGFGVGRLDPGGEATGGTGTAESSAAGTWVETTISPAADGIVINGSSTRNQAGLFIAWQERLTRR